MKTLSLAIFLSVIFGLTGCSALPDTREIKRLFGLEQSFAHTDIAAPPTPGGYVLQLAMGQTVRIDTREPISGQETQITDQPIISDVLAILHLSQSVTPSAAALPAIPLQLRFIIGSSERIVEARYDPGRGELLLYNIPTMNWPDHTVATYAVSPAFGAALRETLAQQLP